MAPRLAQIGLGPYWGAVPPQAAHATRHPWLCEVLEAKPIMMEGRRLFVRVNFAPPQKVDIATHSEYAYLSGTDEKCLVRGQRRVNRVDRKG
jgi:hypothetical protein